MPSPSDFSPARADINESSQPDAPDLHSAFEVPSIRASMDECRARFGAAPRRFGWHDRSYLRPATLPWVQKDALKRLLKDRALLLSEAASLWAPS